MKKIMLTGLILFCSIYGMLSAQILGKIDYIEGNAELVRDGSSVSVVDIGTRIENLDQIKTSPDGLVTIAFDRNSGLTGTLQIAPNTVAIIRQDQISGTSANEVQLMAGSVGLKVKRLAGLKSSVQVRTPTAILGVRGTEFVVASFNGSSLVACKEGEVSCAAYSGITGAPVGSGGKVSSVPGTLVEVQESGSFTTGIFPDGDFDKNWNDVQKKWKNFYVDIFIEDPVGFMNNFINNWTKYSNQFLEGSQKLRSNKVLKNWLRTTKSGKVSGSYSDWVKERPAVMKDMIALRPNMMMTMITWYRLQELIPFIPASSMSKQLSNGQTVRTFVDNFTHVSKNVSDAIEFFNAAEKQYMLRNDGMSPFSDF